MHVCIYIYIYIVGALGLGDCRLCVSWAQGPSQGLKTIRGGVNTIKGTHANG